MLDHPDFDAPACQTGASSKKRMIAEAPWPILLTFVMPRLKCNESLHSAFEADVPWFDSILQR